MCRHAVRKPLFGVADGYVSVVTTCYSVDKISSLRACTPRAGRLKFRAPWHGAARWQGPPWSPEKRPCPNFQWDREYFPRPGCGRRKFWAPRQGAGGAQVGFQKTALAQYSEDREPDPRPCAIKPKFGAGGMEQCVGGGPRGIPPKKPFPGIQGDQENDPHPAG